MKGRKDLIVAVLATFCLTVTLFTIVPIRSQNPAEYDPWKDLNDDGVIDSTDLGLLGTSWATTGDPTKKVQLKYDAYNVSRILMPPPSSADIISAITTGYKEVTLCLWSNKTIQTVYVSFHVGGWWATVDSFTLNAQTTFWKTYKVIGQEISVYSPEWYLEGAVIYAGLYITA